ncbi:MAG: VWA domain-containing protein [Myxococcales bacterium]|nr:VWA domain-containing protein [Myxococcales bacterium]
MNWRAAVGLWGITLVAGCAGGTVDEGGQTGVSSNDSMTTDGGAPGLGGWSRRDGGDDSECLGVEVSSDVEIKPVDLILAIDASGSMNNELTTIQNNLNKFSSDVVANGADLRTVVITKKDYFSVPPPLGTDPSRYRFYESPVSSHDALAHVLAYFPQYKAFLRPNAVTHILVVSDDYSFFEASCFKQIMDQKLGQSFVFDTISSRPQMAPAPLSKAACACDPSIQISTVPPADPPIYGFVPECALDFSANRGGNGCAGAFGSAAQYYDLVRATAGLGLSICTADWSEIFDELTEEVSRSALPCSIDIPKPPEGYRASSDDVTVVYTEAGKEPKTLDRAPSSDCTTGQWYLVADGDELVAELCPDMCREVGKHAGAIAIERQCAIPVI